MTQRGRISTSWPMNKPLQSNLAAAINCPAAIQLKTLRMRLLAGGLFLAMLKATMKSQILRLAAKSLASILRAHSPRAWRKPTGLAGGLFWLVLGWLACLPLAHAQNLVLTASNSAARIGWYSYPGQSYQLQCAAEVNTNTSWFDLGLPVVGAGTTNYVSDPMVGNRRFYRVKRSGHQVWETVADMPTGRGSLGAATGPDGRTYAIGG